MPDDSKRRDVLKGLGAGLTTGIAGCLGGTGGGGGPIKIGANYPLSGGLALFGQDAVRGVELAVESINADGGIGGREIELIKKDAKNTEAGVSNVEALADQENVDVIFGSFSSSIAKASSQAAARFDVIYWETTGFSPEISEPAFDHLYHCNTRTTQYGQEAGKIINNIVAPALEKNSDDLRIGVLYENGVFGTATKDEVERQRQDYGYEVVGTEGYAPFSVNDLSSSVEKFKQAEPDLLYHSGYNADTNLFWRQATDLDFYVPAVVGNGTAYVVQSFVEAVGRETALGVINVDQPHYNANSNFAPGMESLLAAYRDRYGENPVTQLPATTMSCTEMFREVASNAASFGLDDFEEAALAVDEPLGTFTNGWGANFTEDTHRNQHVSVLATQWQPDEFTQDLYHPERSDGTLDVYGIYPEEAKVDYTDVGFIPRPEYTG